MTKTTSTKAKTSQPVDLAVLQHVYDQAMERLAEVQRRERAETGAAQTSLASIGRTAILTWKPDGRRSYTPTPRSPNGEAPDRTPFRFRVATSPYAEAQARIHAAGLSITQVVEEALARFAQTGR